MRNLENKNRVFDWTKAQKYGFIKNEDSYVYKKKISNDQFEVIVSFSSKKNTARLIDLVNEEDYVLVDIDGAVGEFVGKLRLEYESVINDVIEKCTSLSVYKSDQTLEIIRYVKDKYGDDLEFLWEKYDDSAIWRNKQNSKWYAVIMEVSKKKLSLDSDELVEIIDLRYKKGCVNEIIDKATVFPGYHMNKESWITIILDGRLSTEKIERLIDNSYTLSISKVSVKQEELSKKVFEYLTYIPKGKVVTYKQIAEYLGNKGLSRVVGNILHKNPDGDKYPCFKVLNSKGELASNFAFGGRKVQKERLENEGITVIDGKVDLEVYQWEK